MPRKLPPGVYLTPYGYRAIVNTSIGRTEKRFPPDTELSEMRRWRDEAKGALAAVPRPKADGTARGTLAADIRRHLKTLTIASLGSRASDLKAWADLYGDLPRRRLTKDHALTAVKGWHDAEFAPWTIWHRVNALRKLYKSLDGADAPTPVDGLELRRPSKGHPTYVPPATIAKVARALKVSGERHALARVLVLSTTGVRPAELQRAVPADVSLTRKVWAVRTAKGGLARVMHLNTADMMRAWKYFISVDAWGPYDTSQHADVLRRAGWPADVRPYALRATWGMELSMHGTDLRDIQTLMGHRDIETTALYYVPAMDTRLAAATKGLARRFAGQALPTITANTATAHRGRKRRTVQESASTETSQKTVRR